MDTALRNVCRMGACSPESVELTSCVLKLEIDIMELYQDYEIACIGFKDDGFEGWGRGESHKLHDSKF